MYIYRAYFALIFGFECNIKNFRQTPFYRLVNKKFTRQILSYENFRPYLACIIYV